MHRPLSAPLRRLAGRAPGSGRRRGTETERSAMSQVCQVNGKRALTGMNVSHSHIRTKKRSLPNLRWKRYWLGSENRFVRLRVSTASMRIIDKRGIEVIVTEIRSKGE